MFCVRACAVQSASFVPHGTPTTVLTPRLFHLVKSPTGGNHTPIGKKLVSVGLRVEVGVGVAVGVGVRVNIGVEVAVGLGVGVGVDIRVGVGVT
jgi:hypothetical protein